ncbi:MAG: leucyl aminopeptidase [Acidobacteriota bacterium]
MNVKGSSQSCEQIDVEALAVPVFKDEEVGKGLLKTLDQAVGGLIATVIKNEEFAGKEGETAYFHVPGRGLKARRLLLIGCGDRDAYKATQLTQMAGSVTRFLRSKNVKTIAICPRTENEVEKTAQTVVVGAIMGLFEPDKYRTKDKEKREIEELVVLIDGADKKAVQAGADRGRIIGESINFTRDQANEPGGFLTPTILADRAKAVAKEFGLSIDVLDQKRMEKLGMGSLLGVSRGSDEPPRLIVMKYEPKKPAKGSKDKLLALVGKGITFDSGGISLKPGENMELMKYDMTGAATVIGTMRAIAQLKPSIPVLGVAPCSENLPSGKATKPGDVLIAMTGKTIEVINTDAEGRLVLADAIAYAKQLGATQIIDMATLTGAVSIALGDVNTAILGTDQALIDDVISAGKEVGEKFWQLPLDNEYTKQIKSDIADIKNVGGKKAGTITAAAFLKEFAEDTSWAHLDIAGTAWGDPATPYRSKGPTGVAVRTLIEFVERLARQSA